MKLKPIPVFKTETEEREFWETHDSSNYVDWSKASRARFPNLKASTSKTDGNSGPLSRSQ